LRTTIFLKHEDMDSTRCLPSIQLKHIYGAPLFIIMIPFVKGG
jgi:hypothetical protein